MTSSVGEVQQQTAVFNQPFTFQSGAQLSTWQLSYETYGTLNADKSNAVLVCHALSGSQHAAGWYADNPKDIGWWDNFIGIGKPLDTEKFFVLSVNNLGGCHGSTGPSSPHPKDGMPYGSRFPVVTVEDWVHSQRHLADRLGITQFTAVVGGSLGGMQALRWAIDFPERLRAAVAIAAAAKLTALNIGFNEVARRAILNDPDFYGGDYYDKPHHPQRGLSVARMLGHLTYLSDAQMSAKFGRERREQATYHFGTEFQVESYLRHQGEKFSGFFDANTYLLMTRALDYFDPAAGGDLAAAFASITAKIFLLSFSSDWRFPPRCSEEMTQSLLRAGKDVSYLEIESQEGHDSFLLAAPAYHRAVRAFMNRLAAEDSSCA